MGGVLRAILPSLFRKITEEGSLCFTRSAQPRPQGFSLKKGKSPGDEVGGVQYLNRSKQTERIYKCSIDSLFPLSKSLFRFSEG